MRYSFPSPLSREGASPLLTTPGLNSCPIHPWQRGPTGKLLGEGGGLQGRSAPSLVSPPSCFRGPVGSGWRSWLRPFQRGSPRLFAVTPSCTHSSLIRGCRAVNKNDYFFFQLDRIAQVIASRWKTRENIFLKPFRGKVGGRRRSVLAVSETRCKKNSCMCNRHDKRVLGGAMMVGSSDLEAIFPRLLGVVSYFFFCLFVCLRCPWDFLCQEPPSAQLAAPL